MAPGHLVHRYVVRTSSRDGSTLISSSHAHEEDLPGTVNLRATGQFRVLTLRLRRLRASQRGTTLPLAKHYIPSLQRTRMIRCKYVGTEFREYTHTNVDSGLPGKNQ
jgi:hypothetical protein